MWIEIQPGRLVNTSTVSSIRLSQYSHLGELVCSLSYVDSGKEHEIRYKTSEGPNNVYKAILEVIQPRIVWAVDANKEK